MKKILIAIGIIITIFFILPTNASAIDENHSDESFEKQYLLEAQGYLDGNLNDEVSNYLNENNIGLGNPESMTNISISSVFKGIGQMFLEFVKAPMKLFGYLIGILLLCAMLGSMTTSDSGSSLNKVLDLVGVLICITILYKYITESINITAQALTDGANFMTVFVPIYSSVIASSGSITSAGVYNVSIMVVCNFVIQIAGTILIPLLSIFMALTIVNAINPALNLTGFTSGIKTFVQWTLGLVMTIFVGMVSIQSIIGVSADTVGIRTAKFVASSFIPVVGGAISDAYSTVKGSLGLIRSGVGTYGIIILLLTVVPPILSIVAVKLVISISSFVGEILGVEKITSLLKSTSSVLSISLGVLISFALMMVVATAVLMMVGMNLV